MGLLPQGTTFNTCPLVYAGTGTTVILDWDTYGALLTLPWRQFQTEAHGSTTSLATNVWQLCQIIYLPIRT